MKKCIGVIICFGILIIIGIIILPMPEYMNVTFQGSQLSEGEWSDQHVTMTVKGWRLHYLFRSDKIKGSLIITPAASSRSKSEEYEFFGDVFPPNNDVQWISILRFNGELNEYTIGTLFFNKNVDLVMAEITILENQKIIYAASQDSIWEADEIINYFK